MAHDIILFGLGAMGQRMARLAASRDYRINAAIDPDPAKAGQPLGRVVGLEDAMLGPLVTADANAALAQSPRATVLHATGSFLREIAGQVELCLSHGHDVISIAEEMTLPAAADPELAERLDAHATRYGARVMGTGVNPGFAMDVLALALTIPMGRVDHLHLRRTNDLSDFGPTVLRGQGVGLSPEAFEEGLRSGAVVGHVGFPQSIGLIGRHLGWRIDRITETRAPILSTVARETPHMRIDAGQVAGCLHSASAYRDGQEVMRLEHPQQIRPEAEGQRTSDMVSIRGDHRIEMTIAPEIPGGAGTAAAAVNAVAHLRHAAPGLVHLTDLPLTVPRA